MTAHLLLDRFLNKYPGGSLGSTWDLKVPTATYTQTKWTDTPLNKAQTFPLLISFPKNDSLVSTGHWKGNHSPLRVLQSPRALVFWILLPTLWESQQERLVSVVTTFLDETEPMENPGKMGHTSGAEPSHNPPWPLYMYTMTHGI